MTVIQRQTVAGRTRTCNGTCHKAEHRNCRCICLGRWHGCATVKSGKSQPKTIEEAEALLKAQTRLEEVMEI